MHLNLFRTFIFKPLSKAHNPILFYPNNKNYFKKCFRNTQKNPTKNPNSASPPCTSPDSYQLSTTWWSHAFPDLLFMTYYITWSVLNRYSCCLIFILSFTSSLPRQAAVAAHSESGSAGDFYQLM